MLNDAVVRYVLDTADKDILVKPDPSHVTFKDVKEFHVQHPFLWNLLTQIERSKLSDGEIKKQLRKNKR